MARPRSEDKRNAILSAAAHAVGEQGMAASTARIAKQAGVAEGTVFTYFANKDALLNALYVDLKDGLRKTMTTGYPHDASAETRLRHAWNGYLAWGLAHPHHHRALRKLSVSDRINDAHRAAGAAGFETIGTLLRAHGGPNASDDVTGDFIGALFNSMAETTMEFIAQHPAHADVYRERGFHALWSVVRAQ